MKRLGILASHPIQYHVPWFRALSAHPALDVEVFFCHRASSREQAIAGFGVEFEWDVPMFGGYAHRFLENVARTPSIHEFNGLDTPEIKEIIAQGRYDAIIVSGWHFRSAWQAMRACWQTQTPVMVRGDSHLYTRRNPVKRAVKRVLYRLFIPKFNACLAVGKWSKEYYLHYGARPDRVFLVPHIIDYASYSLEAERLAPERFDLRRRWGVNDSDVVFLFAGKFVEQKRPLDFLRAVDIASKGSTAVTGLMAGDGQLRSDCEGFVKKNKTPVRFTGFLNQSEIAHAYAASDVLVLPSSGETWGLVVNEAMASGKPCIISDQVGCAPELIAPQETGDIFPVGNVRALADLMAKYAENRETLASMGSAAKVRATSGAIELAVENVIKAIDASACGQQ